MYQNEYEVLGVRVGADLDTCKKAYRALCKKYHPDTGSGNAEKFIQVQKAFESIKRGTASVPKVHEKFALSHLGLFRYTKIAIK